MSRSNAFDVDNDSDSLSSSSDTDDHASEFNFQAHRSCSRYASCNMKKHQHTSASCTKSKDLSKRLQPKKGDIRRLDNESGHRQKFDGIRWRRMCSYKNCSVIANNGIYYDSWLCRKHYVQPIDSNISRESNRSTVQDIRTTAVHNTRFQCVSARQLNKRTEHHKRGDIMIDANGIRQKYDGEYWRRICSINNCNSFMAVRGFCHRHDREDRMKSSEREHSLITNSNNDRRFILSAASSQQKARKVSSTKVRPLRGEIRSVRQRWNGKKWYSLCHHPSLKCERRSGGADRAHLCGQHYKEYKSQSTTSNVTHDRDLILLSPTIKRKKLALNETNTVSSSVPHMPDTRSSCQPSVDRNTVQIEHAIQTDITYSVDSVSLEQGCILVHDDDDEFQSQSSEIICCTKKEKEEHTTNRLQITRDLNLLRMNCKLELTKIEIS